MAELVYAFDLKSNEETHMGSSPIPGTSELVNCLSIRQISVIMASGRVAEWLKAPVLKTGRLTPRRFESCPFRQEVL